MTRAVWWVLVTALTTAIVGAGAMGAWLLVEKNRKLDPVVVPAAALANDPAARQAVLDVAKPNVPKVLTYSADTVEQDIAAATAVLTGDFLAYYKDFASQTVIPGAQQDRISTTATVVAAAVESLTADRTTVVVFVNQATTKDGAPVTNSSSSILVGMTRVDGKWLIDQFKVI